jgi:hypothetical protein
VARKRRAKRIPDAEREGLHAAIASFGDPALSGSVRGAFCYVGYEGTPLCRLGYRGGDGDLWDFAIYRYSRGTYSNSGTFFPDRATLLECIRIALYAYNLM